jgi:triosephosphate isomerase
MKKWIVANWKMNGDLNLAKSYIENFKHFSNLIVAPPFVYLSYFESMLCAGQNIYYQTSGAFTGEISASQLKDVDAKFCLVGHSERRQYFGDTNSIVKQKAIRCIEKKIVPIICIGESLDDYINGHTQDILEEQIKECVPNVGDFWIAYEPLWAIGTGKTPLIAEIKKIHSFIKLNIPEGVQVMYGGSVKSANIVEILNLPEVDGALVGGASLAITEMQEILKASTAI